MSKRMVYIGCLVLLTAALALQGCVKANFTQPISQFQESINKSASAISSYYTNLNNLERIWYLDVRLFNPTLRVEVNEKVGTDRIVHTPLAYSLFSPEGIKARTDSILLIGEYANRLGALAGTEAPANIGTSIGKLGENLDDLAYTFKSLAKEQDDPTAGKYFGPISSIVGVFAQHYSEMKREQLLEKAILEGAPAVNALLDLIESDLLLVVRPLQTTGFRLALNNRMSKYNQCVTKYKEAIAAPSNRPDRRQQTNKVGSGSAFPVLNIPGCSEQDRKRQLADIQKAAENYQLVIMTNPVNLVEGIRQANAALVAYAKSEKTPQDLTSLVGALYTFKSQVEVIVAAVNKLRLAGGS